MCVFTITSQINGEFLTNEEVRSHLGSSLTSCKVKAQVTDRVILIAQWNANISLYTGLYAEHRETGEGTHVAYVRLMRVEPV